MTTQVLDAALFRQLFAEFADPAAYSDAVLQYRWTEAVNYISADDSCDLSGAQRQHAVLCMTAHLMRLAATIAAGTGGVTGVVTGATIDKVSVTLQPPPVRSGSSWSFWLAQTPYGQQLSALLSQAAVGGMFVGGWPERSGFRKAGGVF